MAPVPHTTDIGRRIELVSMDPHFYNISIGLYRQHVGKAPALLVHTYSRLPGAEERIRCVIDAMVVLGGIERKGEGDSLLAFPCGSEHTLAARRLPLFVLGSDEFCLLRLLFLVENDSVLDLLLLSLSHRFLLKNLLSVLSHPLLF